jgi:hypothetical protein
MAEEERITYRFRFPEGEEKEITLLFRLPAMDLILPTGADAPPWTWLAFQQCPNCPLHPDRHTHCPVARNLVGAIDSFRDFASFDEVDVTVITREREMRKQTSLQKGLSSLIGIIMATSGCPHMDKLRPMVITHLPFATLKETTYRAISMYLMAQYVRSKHGKPADWALGRLVAMYEAIRTVNQSFVRRLQGIQKKDANLNALVHLDCFALTTISTIVDNWWEDLKPLFLSYLKDI